MKKVVTLLSVVWLLSACNSLSQSANNTNSCPQPTAAVQVEPNPQIGYFEPFDYQIRNIVKDNNKIKFQTTKYDFVFCRSNNNWTVQAGTLPSELQPPQNYSQVVKEIVNPAFKSITFNERTYQYRVRLEPNYTLSEGDILSRPEVSPENDKVVFELTTPDSQQPQQTILYTLKDLQTSAVQNGFSSIGTRLGVPQITAAVTDGQRIWWAIAFEQGEGNNGIATIVSYQPQTNQLTLFQPQEITSQQITDLVVTGEEDTPTLWLGTKISGEGNPNIPAYGLVAYRPNLVNPNASSLKAYTVHNSPLVGAIPTQLEVEGKTLWVGTGNGICQVQWQAAENPDRWLCWRFALMAKLPSEARIYRGLLEKTPAATLPNTQSEVEVLWSQPLDYQTRQSRYEVRYQPGFTVTLNEGAKPAQFPQWIAPGEPAIDWVGSEWHWQGDRFVRGWDEVAENDVGGGPRGIASSMNVEPNRPSNFNAMRGDLEILAISENTTTLKHYSGWVDDVLNPYLTVVPQARGQTQPNPLTKLEQ
ncbi:hypothetical protein [Chroococcidiopsis sp. TS-821]|uniref:hypothetical protein n=1 Tax=Chroococcidiopsis sp. TS-821 TaxID=1378066 RepID=UPI000CEEC76D|nr:hypothetical protein [Chroococcidiopsis sp. TS-821]PPS42678.1 hypothetical protein B1A85_13220 [Chroococcidiopsis sp. TS-821]